MPDNLISINPATEKIISTHKTISTEQAIKQIMDLKRQSTDWKNLDIKEKLKLIKKISDNLKENTANYASIITQEMGKPIKQSIAEVNKCAWICDYYSENAEKFLEAEFVQTESYKSYVRFDPLGVILGIMPWNFPFLQVFRYAVPALITGNSCILKHSSNVPNCAIAIEKIFNDSQINAFQTLLISGTQAQVLIEKDLVDAVSLTGSTQAGSQVAQVAGKNLKKVVLELGGNDPFIILKDADLEKTAKQAALARFQNNGQSCIASKRFIVQEEIADEFTKLFSEKIQELTLGDPMNESTYLGPLARKDLQSNISNQVADAKLKGAKIITGGKIPKDTGYFYEPTLLTNVNHQMHVLSDETFGPVASIIKVKREDQAVQEANKTIYGLGASIWTNNLERAENLAKHIDAGTVAINKIVASDPRLPFGGVKKSGIGRELSQYGLKEFTNIKTVVVEKH